MTDLKYDDIRVGDRFTGTIICTSKWRGQVPQFEIDLGTLERLETLASPGQRAYETWQASRKQPGMKLLWADLNDDGRQLWEDIADAAQAVTS